MVVGYKVYLVTIMESYAKVLKKFGIFSMIFITF
jgi:hypothetical protein